MSLSFCSTRLLRIDVYENLVIGSAFAATLIAHLSVRYLIETFRLNHIDDVRLSLATARYFVLRHFGNPIGVSGLPVSPSQTISEAADPSSTLTTSFYRAFAM